MVLTSTGEVVTNHHVVEGATTVRVTVMSTGTNYRATVVGTDAKDDVAVLQLQGASGLQTVTPDTDGTSVGDAVTAVGDAGGDTSTFTAAAGKIMAEDQSITTRSEPGHPGERLRGLIKISSDVMSGDSGGATYDDEGEVIGMTTAATSGTSDVVGYAIPVAQVISIAGDLENGTQNTRYEYGSPAFLGLGLGNTGTRVAAVYPGTPAATAGVGVGDTITGIGTTGVSTSTQLRSAVQTYSPGDSVRITWTDPDGTSHTASVTLIAGPVA
jgi:S1-C subfamily serine protease